MPGRPLPILLLLILAIPLQAQSNWPQFRGPSGNGQASSKNLPLTWSETQNVKFKTPVPGQGHSSPVIFGNQIWLTTATENGYSLRVLAFDRTTGKNLHDIEVFRPQALQRINKANTHASPSPVIEKDRLYVCFGAYGSACLDTNSGKILWKNQDLTINHMEGPGSSPIIYNDLFILHCDGIDHQYIAALDKNTGKQVWKTLRSTPFGFWVVGPLRKAYSTPLIANIDGQDQLLSTATRRFFSYDPQTGKELWCVDLDGPSYSVAPRPIFHDGVAYILTGHDKSQLWAVKTAGASGNITQSHVLWKVTTGMPLRPSPVLADGAIFVLSDSGTARCLDPKTGQLLWQKRVTSNASASPIHASGRLYFFDDKGKTTILQASKDEPKILSENTLNEGCLATPAISDDILFIRTKSHLYRIGN